MNNVVVHSTTQDLEMDKMVPNLKLYGYIGLIFHLDPNQLLESGKIKLKGRRTRTTKFHYR